MILGKKGTSATGPMEGSALAIPEPKSVEKHPKISGLETKIT